jgi:glycosyltransferase involved in cell wall biosynthesis
LGRGLIQRDRSVLFLTSLWHNGDFVDRLKQSNLSAHTLPLGFFSTILTRECLRKTAVQAWRWPGLLWKYCEILRCYKAEKVIHTSYRSLLLLKPFLRPERDLLWLHECIPDHDRYRRLFRSFEKRVHSFVCVSKAVAISLHKIGVNETRIRIIHNGVKDFTAGVLPQPESHAPFRIGIAGQISPAKGHDDLLEAFGLVCQRHSRAELHIYGTGQSEYIKALKRKATTLGIENRIMWHDFVTDRKLIYSNVDVCVVPSRFEDPLPTCAIEAGLFGKACIATRRGGLPEIITDELNGLLVGAEQPAEIAEAICRLIAHPELRQSLGVNARHQATKRFSPERFVGEFLDVLDAKGSCF